MPAPSPIGRRMEAAGLAKTANGMVNAGMYVVILKINSISHRKIQGGCGDVYWQVCFTYASTYLDGTPEENESVLLWWCGETVHPGPSREHLSAI